MKRNVLSMAVLSIALLIVGVYACQKQKQKDEVNGPGGTVTKNIGPCDGHGGSSGRGGVSWALATRKSGCNKGIGFRCGHTFWAECNDGEIVKWHLNAPAPGSYPRNMNAKFTFLTVDRLKLTFETRIPEEEPRDAPFDIEDDVIEDLPEDFELDGAHYSRLIIKAGLYPIDYSDGLYGSVEFKVSLLP